MIGYGYNTYKGLGCSETCKKLGEVNLDIPISKLFLKFKIKYNVPNFAIKVTTQTRIKIKRKIIRNFVLRITRVNLPKVFYILSLTLTSVDPSLFFFNFWYSLPVSRHDIP